MRSAMHSDQFALVLLARQGERRRMVVERVALRAEAAAMVTLNVVQEERCKLIPSMQDERSRVREAEAEERKQSAEAELQRLSCWKQNAGWPR